MGGGLTAPPHREINVAFSKSQARNKKGREFPLAPLEKHSRVPLNNQYMGYLGTLVHKLFAIGSINLGATKGD